MKDMEPKPLASLHDWDLIFESNEEIDFPTINYGKPKIPHMVHYVYKNITIPVPFVRKIRSFYVQNPDWSFRFWTFKSGRELIEKTYPYLLNIYDMLADNEKDNEKKSNMLRYVALYEYGGVSGDLFVYNRLPLDRVTVKYSCIIPCEPFEHSALNYNFDMILSSSFILCQEKHTFMEIVLQKMRIMNINREPFDVNGGGLLTQIFMEYNNIDTADLRKRKTENSSNSPFFYKGERAENDTDGVYIPNTQYFTGDVHPQMVDNRGNLKDCTDQDTLQGYLTKRACVHYDSRVKLRENRKYFYTGYAFDNVWSPLIKGRKIHIKKVIPNVIL